MSTNLSIPEGLDPQVVNLARSIRQQESSGNYTKFGDNDSSYGAYQWNNQPAGKSVPLKNGQIPSNFQADAKEAGLDPTDFSPKNQDMVAYNKIKKLKDAGNNVVDIAAIWNGGDAKRQDPNYVTPSGLPSQKKGVYDVPAYAKKVNDYYQNLKEKSQTDTRKTFSESLATTPSPSQSQYSSPQHSPKRIAQYNAEQQGYDKNAKDLNSPSTVLGNTITGIGDNLSFGQASKLGEQEGTGLARTYNQVKGLLGGQDNSKYIPEMDLSKTATGLAGTVGGILSTAAGSGELNGIIKGGSALESPVIKTILREGSNLLPEEATSTLAKGTAEDILQNKLKDLSVSDVTGEKGQAILRALKELNPKLIEKQNLLARLAKQGFNLVKGGVLAKIFDDTVGGLIHQNTK